ncbi:MAG: rod shape-determining protein MreC [Alphaproteobacteria bacterium]|nr:rod shape-determining protein MreC [Alphaproteobacteria bacterium]
MIPLSMLRRSAAQRLIAPLLVVFSVTMIVLGKVDQTLFEQLRISATDYAAPLLDGLSRPFVAITDVAERARAMIDTYHRNVSLTEENTRLLHWRQAALALAEENKALRDLLKLAPESARSFVSARVIASSGGAYLRNLLVDAGSENGIARGQAAVVGEGLIGRVSEVGTRAARILLITDLNSRVPVVVERSGQRAILAGDNSEKPALWFIEPAAPLRIGDRIVTSGEGGIFPPGLPVGIVFAVEPGQPRVEPYRRPSQVEYVRIVDYGLAQGLPMPVAAPRGAPHAAPTGIGRTSHR